MKRQHTYNRTLLVLVAVNILNFYDRNVLGALTEPIRKEFTLTDTQVGLLGSAFIHLTWVGLTDASVWIAVGLSLLFLVLISRWG